MKRNMTNATPEVPKRCIGFPIIAVLYDGELETIKKYKSCWMLQKCQSTKVHKNKSRVTSRIWYVYDHTDSFKFNNNKST